MGSCHWIQDECNCQYYDRLSCSCYFIAMVKYGAIMSELIVIGGGLAGSEAAWQAAERGLGVTLYEMRPKMSTGAHTTPHLAELVCSNSLGTRRADRASGLLKMELRMLGSLLIRCAEEAAVPAGGALAVDRNEFSRLVTRAVEGHNNIEVIREEVTDIPDQMAVVASGPLTSQRLSEQISELTGDEHLYFYDAISPVVFKESIDMSIAFRGSRYSRGDKQEGDYINCPMTEGEYNRFINELMSSERIELKEFELDINNGVNAGFHQFFEGCLPIEIMAQRGRESLAFGPLRPVGLVDPRSGNRPYAVVQLRQDNLADTLYNLVGFQTNLKFSEQRRVLRMIPGLENVEFARYGQMHRNTFIFSPANLRQTLQFKRRNNLFFAGQITGVESYAGNIATGVLAGLNCARYLHGQSLLALPRTTMLGALCHYITHASQEDFQPMKANFGILPKLEGERKLNKSARYEAYSARAMDDLGAYLESVGP